jgi:hypothetical protein
MPIPNPSVEVPVTLQNRFAAGLKAFVVVNPNLAKVQIVFGGLGV